MNVHYVKKVPRIDHSKCPLKEIVKNLFNAKLTPLSYILTSSSSAICHLVWSQCSMLSVYLKCVSRFFQWIRISNKEFVSNSSLQMEFRMRNRWKCYIRPSTSSTEVNIANVKEMVTEYRHSSLREIAAEISESHESIRTILNDQSTQCVPKITELYV